MKRFFLPLLLLAGVGLQAQTLRFGKDHTFKIVQFTDVHFQYGNPASQAASDCIEEVLKAERPDLVVFTGDVVYAKPALKGMEQVLAPVLARKLPFAVVFGNHDDEHDATREQLQQALQQMPGCLNAADVAELSGQGNFLLELKGRAADSTAALLYFLDSHSYSRTPGVGGYAPLALDQVNWYAQQSARYKAEHKGHALPALAFFHIPLPEFAEAAAHPSATILGTRMEKPCPPELNTGMFAAMRQGGDVLGMFVGHDHDNDYAVNWKGIALCYGRYTGGNTVYNNLPNGARVIELREGERAFRSWIRVRGGQVLPAFTFPKDFVRMQQ